MQFSRSRLVALLRSPLMTWMENLGQWALLHALPEDFQAFTSSLMLLPQLDYPTVKDAVVLEEQNCQPRPSDAPIAL
jgi:hypothetical protein